MRLFKQSYQANIAGDVLECKIVLDAVKKISYEDIASLTGGVLPYAIRFWYKGSKHRWYFDYYQSNGVYKAENSKWIRIPYGRDIVGRVTLCGNSQDCMEDFGAVDVGINTNPDRIVLYGVKSQFGSYTFESNKESAVSTHKIAITANGYDVTGLGADRYCRVLDKASEYYGKLFSEVEDKDALWSYYWHYRKKRCIDLDALAMALGMDEIGGTSWQYCAKYICED